MKKTLRLMGLCALVVLALAGCKKNEQTGTKTFKATISQLNSDARTSIGIIGNDTVLVWSDNDMIKVYTAEKAGATFTISGGQGTTEATFNGTLEASESYTAIYPANNVDVNTDGNIEFQLSGTQTYVGGNFTTDLYPMYATSTNGNFTFYSPCGILALQLKGTATIGSIELTDSTHMDLAGTFELTGTDVNFHDTHSTLGILMDFGANGLTLDANTATLVYFVVPEGAFAGGFKAEVKGTDGNRIVLLETSTPNTITAETIHLMPEVAGVNGSTVPDGYLPGIFTIDNTGRQIRFAKGNLQYQVPTGNWRFAEHQWDYCQIDDGPWNTSDWIDLFGWGTWTGSNPNPTNTSDESVDYSFVDTDFDQTLYGSDVWRTLNYEEWRYLFCTRANADDLCGLAKVDGNNGIVILPQDWILPSGSSFNPGLIIDTISHFVDNIYDVSQWAAMEAAGAVFLPAVGERSNSYGVWGAGLGGDYWTSTPYNMYNAYELHFSGYTNYLCDYEENLREFGYSVRLVRDYDGTGGGGTGGGGTGGSTGGGINGMNDGGTFGW